MAHTGFIVPMPQAAAWVGDLRERFDASAALGVPPHVTLLFPFMAPEQIEASVLQDVRGALDGAPAFDFSLAGVARFAATAYLEPSPAAPFIDLTERLAGRFPRLPPFGGEFPTVVPHLTVAHGDAPVVDRVCAELSKRIAKQGAIRGRCDRVVLLENTLGRWREMHAFALGHAPGTA
jgi:2'-5' RNA ligase